LNAILFINRRRSDLYVKEIYRKKSKLFSLLSSHLGPLPLPSGYFLSGTCYRERRKLSECSKEDAEISGGLEPKMTTARKAGPLEVYSSN
jgi:hypothetical protein